MSINMNSKKIKAQFAKETNPRVGLIVLSTDNMIEKDFSKVLSDKPVAVSYTHLTLPTIYSV